MIIQVFTNKFCSVLIWDKCSLRYFRNTNSQSEPRDRGQAKLDFYGFTQSSLQNYILQGSKAIFLSWITGICRRGRDQMITKLVNHPHFSPVWGGDKKLSSLPICNIFFPFIIRKNRPVCIIHTKIDEPQVFYITCALCFYPPRTLPCPHCALSSFLWFYSVKCLSSLSLNCRFRSKAEFTTSPIRADLNCAGKPPSSGWLVTVIELRFHPSQGIITLLFISIPTH